MKIACENCGAKYSIADEKVKGKAFKIRCKKCGESIVVRGDISSRDEEPAAAMPAGQRPQEEEVETKVFDYSTYQSSPQEEEPAVWHIVVEGQQQGPYTGSQIIEYLGAGSLDGESYIWKEGFGDWKPIREVPELYSAAPPAAAAPAPMAAPDPFGVAASPKLEDESDLFGAPAAADVSAGGGLFDEAPAAQDDLFSAPSDGRGLFGESAGEAGASPPSPFDSEGGLFGGAPAGAGGDVFSSTPSDDALGGGLFAGGAEKKPGIFAEGARADLFADSPAAEEGGDDIFSGLAQEAPSPVVSAGQMLTGQRNENSVLFSLANLQALAAAPLPSSPKASAPSAMGLGGPAPGFGGAVDEASGLIDIRSLAGSLGADKDRTGVDDLISMGGGGFASSLGAPVLAPQSEGMSLAAKIGIIGGAVLVLAVIVILAVMVLSPKESPEKDQQLLILQAEIEKMKLSGQKEPQKAAAPNQLIAQIKNQQGAPAETAAPAASGEAVEDKQPAAKAPSGEPSSERRSAKSRESRGGGSSKAEAEKPKAEPTKSAAVSELDDLLGGGSKAKAPAPTKPKPAAEPRPEPGGLREKLDRADVQNGMNEIAARVKACGEGQSGTITMQVMIGTTGRVTSAVATGPFANTSVGACAARAVRMATFPKSQQALNVKYPFKL